jgi:hypothetical protein
MSVQKVKVFEKVINIFAKIISKFKCIFVSSCCNFKVHEDKDIPNIPELDLTKINNNPDTIKK